MKSQKKEYGPQNSNNNNQISFIKRKKSDFEFRKLIQQIGK